MKYVQLEYVSFVQGKLLSKLGFAPNLNDCPKAFSTDGKQVNWKDVEFFYPKAFSTDGKEVNWKDVDFFYWRPTLALALKWIRDRHHIYVETYLDQTSTPKFCAKVIRWHDFMDFEVLHKQDLYLGGFAHLHSSYEGLESTALDFILDYLVSQQILKETAK